MARKSVVVHITMAKGRGAALKIHITPATVWTKGKDQDFVHWTIKKTRGNALSIDALEFIPYSADWPFAGPIPQKGPDLKTGPRLTVTEDYTIPYGIKVYYTDDQGFKRELLIDPDMVIES